MRRAGSHGRDRLMSLDYTTIDCTSKCEAVHSVFGSSFLPSNIQFYEWTALVTGNKSSQLKLDIGYGQ